MNQTAEPKTADTADIKLKPEKMELRSPKVQMAFAASAALLICLYCWSASLRVGFLLDDYLHLDYIHRALSGNWADFLSNFTSNWAGSDLMKSYRPLVSLSLFIDSVIWGPRAWGFHLTNLLLQWGCCFFVGLISMELSGLKGNRLGSAGAIWAALLFAVYPMHLEAAAWVIGRVDLLCTLFYLISVFAYFRFKSIRERGYFHLSLITFALAMLSKEMAVTLPLVITAAELILNPLWGESKTAYAQSKRMSAVMSFWFLLGILATWRLVVLQQLIGGYGGSGVGKIKDFVSNVKMSFNTFPHSGTLTQIFFPANLDLVNRLGQQAWDLKVQLDKILGIGYVTVALSGTLRLLKGSASARILLFLLVWLIVGILPTFQIWGIFPNLVGGRLFYLSSAPFVILLSFLAVPTIDALNKNMVKVFSVGGSLALLAILTVWSYWLQFDMQAWTGAADSLQTFREQITNRIRQAGRGHAIAILNLPTDYSGAGMVTRGRYLKYMLRPPINMPDISYRVLTLDPTDEPVAVQLKATGEQPLKKTAVAVSAPQAISGKSYDYSDEISRLIDDPKVAGIYVWHEASASSGAGFLSPWQGGARISNLLSPNWSFDFSKDSCKFVPNQSNPDLTHPNLDELSDLHLNSDSDWTIERDGGRSFKRSASGLRVRPGDKDLLLVFPAMHLSPLKAKIASLKLKILAGHLTGASLLWNRSASGNELQRKANSSLFEKGAQFFTATPFIADSANYSIALSENPHWAVTPEVTSVGLLLPKGDYEIELSSLEIR